MWWGGSEIGAPWLLEIHSGQWIPSWMPLRRPPTARCWLGLGLFKVRQENEFAELVWALCLSAGRRSDKNPKQRHGASTRTLRLVNLQDLRQHERDHEGLMGSSSTVIRSLACFEISQKRQRPCPKPCPGPSRARQRQRVPPRKRAGRAPPQLEELATC